MDNLYEYIEKLVKENGYRNITEFCREAEIPRATMSELKAGRTKQLSIKTSITVANKLNIPISLLLDTDQCSPIAYCSDCGLQFNTDDHEEVKAHSSHHRDWNKAVDKFGFCWEYRYREDRKTEARAILNNPNVVLTDKVKAQIVILKALFSRSLESFGYDLDHPDFPSYVAMILNQGAGRHGIPSDVYFSLIKEFGKKTGIHSGTYYLETNNAPTKKGERKISDADLKFALFGDSEVVSDEDLADVKRYAAFVRERKKEKK